MAIDAVIDNVEIEGANLRLFLRPRVGSDMQDSIPGQTQLLVLDYTVVPSAGQEVWGGSGSCVVEPLWGKGRQVWYDREGYTKLREQTITAR